MSLNTQLSDLTANTFVNTLAALANGGKLSILSGSQPANANTAITSQVELVRLTLNATSFGAGTAGVVTAGAITGVAIATSGTASWFRVYKSDGTTVLFDGTVGTSGTNLVVSTVTFTAGVTLNITSWTFTLPEAGA